MLTSVFFFSQPSYAGMMTGQILGGTVPEQAARYQMIIYFMIATCSILAQIAISFLAAVRCLDEAHCLRLDRLHHKTAIANPWSVSLGRPAQTASK